MKIELVGRTPEKCALYDSLEIKFPARFSHFKLPDGLCLSAKRIEKPVADYSVESWGRDYHVSDIMGIVEDHAYIRERSTGEIVASATQFTHLGGWFRRSIANAMAVGQPDQCPGNMSYALGLELMRMTFN